MTKADITPAQRAVIGAFYHRTRAEWLEWFPSEIARRLPDRAAMLDRDLRDLRGMGLMDCMPSTKRGAGAMVWRVTNAGKAMVAR